MTVLGHIVRLKQMNNPYQTKANNEKYPGPWLASTGQEASDRAWAHFSCGCGEVHMDGAEINSQQHYQPAAPFNSLPAPIRLQTCKEKCVVLTLI